MRAILITVIWLVATTGVVEAQRATGSGSELTAFAGCRLVQSEWADGDSFPVRFPDGATHVVRLYGVDCLETTDRNGTDQRRLRSQRAYFGMARAVCTVKGSARRIATRFRAARPSSLARVIDACSLPPARAIPK